MAALYALIWVNPRSNSAMCHAACLSPANRLTLLFFSVSLARVGEWGLLLFTLLLLCGCSGHPPSCSCSWLLVWWRIHKCCRLHVFKRVCLPTELTRPHRTLSMVLCNGSTLSRPTVTGDMTSLPPASNPCPSNAHAWSCRFSDILCPLLAGRYRVGWAAQASDRSRNRGSYWFYFRARFSSYEGIVSRL